MPTSKRPRLHGPMSKRLRDAREAAGFSRPKLAEAIGVSERAINYYENPNYMGRRKSAYVKAWAAACGRDFEEIWGPPDHPLARTGWLRPTAARTRAA